MHHFTPDIVLEGEIFVSSNLDWECDRIGQLLFEYSEKFIEPALKDGMYFLAVKWYLQMLDSLTVHYIQDEHWTYYDDLYFPDQAVSYIWEQFVPHIRLGKLPGEDLKTLEDGLALIEHGSISELWHTVGHSVQELHRKRDSRSSEMKMSSCSLGIFVICERSSSLEAGFWEVEE